MRVSIRAGQRAARRLMTDTVKITRPQSVTDQETGVVSTDYPPVWKGPCKIQSYEPDSIDTDSAGRPASLIEYRLHLPSDAPPMMIGDIATVSGWVRSFRVDGLLSKTWETSQRLKITDWANQVGTVGP